MRAPSPSLQVLRACVGLSRTVLFLPAMYNTMQVYACKGTWLSTGWSCYAGVHMMFIIVATVVTAAFLAVMILGVWIQAPPPVPRWIVIYCMCLLLHSRGLLL